MGLVTMKCIVLLSLCALSLAKPQSRQVTETEGRIIGGEEAPKHEFPWQVSLKSFGSHICGGSVVNKNQVITAAHCCQGQLAFLDSIVAGAHDRNLEAGHQTRAIASMEYHESCNSPGWGLTTGGGLFLPNHLQWIQIPVHSAADCESIFEGYITENMICAGSAGHATCNGDS